MALPRQRPLLGLSIGQVVQWPMPGGVERRLRVTSVLYQPEAAAASQG